MTYISFFLLLMTVIIHCQEKENTKDIYRRPDNIVFSSSENKKSFTDVEKKLILDLHNAYRSMVIPEAKNMRELVWDDDLENFAINHTHMCTGAHSDNLLHWNFQGEVLYYRHNDIFSIKEAMWMWWSEGQDYNITSNTCVKGRECGHYKLMTTAIISKVGCAVYLCDSFSRSKYPTPATFMTCMYDAMFFGESRPYNVGQTCSECTKQKQGYQFQYCRNKLCIGPLLRFSNSGFSGNTEVTGV